MPSSSAACAIPSIACSSSQAIAGLLRAAEVEAVGERERLAAGAGDVQRGAEDRAVAGRERVALAERRAVERDGDAACPVDAQDGGVESGAPDRARADELVVLLEDPGLRLVVDRVDAAPARRRAAPARGRIAGTRRSAARRGSRRRARRPCTRAARRDRSPRRSPCTAAPSARRPPATASSRSGSTTATMRSCDSEIMISHGSRSASRSGTRSRCTSTPIPSRAISASDEASPAAPQSCRETTSPCSTSSSETSISALPRNGSPIWTDGRFSSEPSRSCDASTDAPPMPSRPVSAP